MSSLFQYIQHENQGRLGAVAVSKGLGGPSLTYSQLFSEIKKISKHFVSGELVSVCLDNCIEHAVLFLAIGAAGAVIAPLNPGYTDSEMEFYLKRSPGGLVVPESAGNVPAELAANRLGIPVFRISTSPDGKVTLSGKRPTFHGGKSIDDSFENKTCLILFTSGTTADPKAVPLSHGNLIASAKNIALTYMLSSSDRTLCIMPLFHIHGLMASLVSTLATGGTVVFPSTGKFSANSFLQELNGSQCTWFSAVPTMLQIISNISSVNLITPHRLRFIRSCSAALPPTLLEKIEALFSVRVLEAYAMTEASHQMTSNPLGDGRRPGTVGLPHGNVQIRIYASNMKIAPHNTRGEVCVKGPSVIKGYLDNPLANSKAFIDGFFRTGDEGFLDKNGFLTITGRLKELINKGGEKISPIEIDTVTLSHPAVAEAVSFAIPDPKYGETVAVAVVLKASKAVTETELSKHIGTKLASFKVPTKIFIANSLPKTATGKVQRRKVAEKFMHRSKL